MRPSLQAQNEHYVKLMVDNMCITTPILVDTTTVISWVTMPSYPQLCQALRNQLGYAVQLTSSITSAIEMP